MKIEVSNKNQNPYKHQNLWMWTLKKKNKKIRNSVMILTN